MENGKPTFLFLKYGMGIGGIEIYIERLARWLMDNQYKVVFLALKGTEIHPDFIDVFNGPLAEIREVDIHSLNWVKKLKGLFDEEELIIAYAFDLYQYAMLEKLKIKLHLKRMNSFYWIPHFEEVFLEDKYPRPFRKAMGFYFGKIIKKLDSNRNIIYVNDSHLKAFEKRYRFHSSFGSDMLIQAWRCMPPAFDETEMKERSRRKPFNILTIGRFTFPHKAYLLGLIEAYGQLKEKYSDITLTIIGYGKDKDEVISKVAALSEKAQNDVSLTGEVAPSELRNYFRNASVHIGVAGCILDSAYHGVISVPVRHYTYKCEGYGYFTDINKIDQLVDSKPGIEIERYIEELIKMSTEDYVELCRKTQEVFKQDKAYGNFGKKEMGQRNVNSCKHLPKCFIFFVQSRYIAAGLWHRLK